MKYNSYNPGGSQVYGTGSIKAFGGEIYHMSRWSEHTSDVAPEQIGKVINEVGFTFDNSHNLQK